MPLLDQNEEEKDKQAQPAAPQPQAPTPLKPATTAVPKPAVNQPQRKGTGFTNLNRVMQANQGNRLSQTVAGGMTGQAQGLQQNIGQSQQAFTQQANKARIDTPEAAAKRGAVLGRFDESQYNVDESKFQMNQGITQDYEAKKAAAAKQLAEQQALAQKQGGTVQSEIAQQQAKLSKLQTQYDAPRLAAEKAASDYAAAQQKVANLEKNYRGPISIFGNYSRPTQEQKDYQAQIQLAKQEMEAARIASDKAQSTYEDWTSGRTVWSDGYARHQSAGGSGLNTDIYSTKAGLSSLQNILKAQQGASAAAEKKINEQIKDYEAQYGKLTEAEKAKWIQSEKDRMVAENMPSEQEMKEFQRYQTGAYEGPKELQDFQSLLGKAQQTEALGGLARSAGGRQELLKQFVGGRQDYTQGQRTLDEAILGQDKTSALTRAAKETRGAEKDVTKANKMAAQEAMGYVSKAKQFGEETRGMIEGKKGELSGRIGEQLKALQSSEAQKQADFQNIQDMLTGKSEATKKLDPMARTALALQLAQDAGYISPEEARGLVGSGGLVKRAGELGTDINKMLAERFKATQALGVDEQAAATSDQEKRMQALDKLMGKQGTDVAFSGKEQYQAGKVGLDFDSLAQEIARQEEARMQSDAGYSQKMQQQKLTPLQQILAGTMHGAGAVTGGVGKDVLTGAALYGGASSALGGLGLGAGGGAGLTASGAMAGAAPYAAAAMLAQDLLTGGDSTARLAEGATAAGMGGANLANQGIGSITEGLRKLNIGGVSLDKSPIGKQLEQIEKLRSETAGKMIGEVGQNAATYAQGLRDLTQGGKLDQALAKLSGADNLTRAVGNVGKSVSKALFGGKTGDWAPSFYNTIDATTGKKVKIGSFANQSSDKILQQLLTQGELDRATIHGKGGKGEGAKVVNELLKYYQAALKREGKA